MPYIIPISGIDASVLPLVGRKSYGIKRLDELGIPTVTRGFVVTTEFTSDYLRQNNINTQERDASQLEQRVLRAQFSSTQQEVLCKAYLSMLGAPLAVRSSATFEDMDNASFGGQYRSHLNVMTFEQFCTAVKDCLASTYSPRALAYMRRTNINPSQVNMAILVQSLVKGKSSGIVLTVDPASECEGILQITASYGLGEAVVSNEVDADIYQVLKSTGAVISRTAGRKEIASVAIESGGIESLRGDYRGFCLTPKNIQTLLEYGFCVEKALGIGQDYEFVIQNDDTVIATQVRPQILHGRNRLIMRRVLSEESAEKSAISSIPVVDGAVYGVLRKQNEGDKERDTSAVVYVSSLNISDIPSLGRTASGLIVDKLAPGSHPALILREMAIPTVTQPHEGIERLVGKNVTLDASLGRIYEGTLPIITEDFDIDTVKKPRTQVHIACSSPQALYRLRKLPLDGIALMRSEFIINQAIGIHPLALLAYDAGELKGEVGEEVKRRISDYSNGREFFIEKLASGIASIAALMPDKPAKYRFCDFQSNDYRGLVGGELFEPQEENPMLGLRGVTRLLTPRFQPAFDLEIEAVKRVRAMGLSHLELLFGFCRSPEDGNQARKYLESSGIGKGKIGMMVELPANYLQADEFAEIFDFFLVGPRDLTQTVYAADRTSPELARYTPAGKAPMKAVMTLLRNLEGRAMDIFIGSYPLFQHLPEYQKISLNNRLHFAELPDNIIDGIRKLLKCEDRLGLRREQ